MWLQNCKSSWKKRHPTGPQWRDWLEPLGRVYFRPINLFLLLPSERLYPWSKILLSYLRTYTIQIHPKPLNGSTGRTIITVSNALVYIVNSWFLVFTVFLALGVAKVFLLVSVEDNISGRTYTFSKTHRVKQVWQVTTNSFGYEYNSMQRTSTQRQQ